MEVWGRYAFYLIVMNLSLLYTAADRRFIKITNPTKIGNHFVLERILVFLKIMV